MILEILGKFNFLDYIILIVLFRICYIAAKTGLSVEIFKFFGVIFAVYIALHYYTTLSIFIQSRFMPKELVLGFMNFIIFLFLVLLGCSCFVVLRIALSRFIQLNALPKISQFLGLVLGMGRGFLIIGLLSFVLFISNVTYLSNSVKRSYLGSKTFVILPQTYGWLWNNIFSKFSHEEKFNPAVTQITEKFNHK